MQQLDQPADTLVSSFFRDHRELGSRERGALAETAYAVLRHRPLLAHLAESGRGPLPRRLALLAWAGDARALAEVPADERAWADAARARAADTSIAWPDALRHQLPVWLAERLLAERGAEAFWPLAAALNGQAPLDLRVNLLKGRRREEVQALLQAEGIEAAATPYSPWGLRLAGRPSLQRWPLFLDGAIEVQDEGSQLLAWLVQPRRGEMVVDFCAGAGGKTLALGAMMRSTGRLYAMDVSGHRLAAFKPRMARSGLSNVHPVQIAHERDDRIRRLAGKVDRVLVDAPCSGLGTLRRNPDLKWRQRASDVAELAALQRRILASAATLLKPGGRLVYATCSLLAEENEAVAADFQASHPGFEPLPVAELLAPLGERAVADGLATPGGHLSLSPDRHGTDGFFAAVWQRPMS